MSVIEDIRNFTEKMSVPFFYKQWVRVCNLEREIARHLQKYMRDRSYPIAFTSQELRCLTIALEKVHKSLNNTSSFRTLKKKFDKYDIIPSSILSEMLKENALRLALARKAQESLGFLNRYCAILDILEKGVEYHKEQLAKKYEEDQKEDAKALNKVLIDALNEARG